MSSTARLATTGRGVRRAWCVVLPAGIAWDGEGVAAVVKAARRGPSRCAPDSRAVPTTAEVVVVHDAARPLAPAALFDAVIDAVRAGADAAVPSIPVADTLKRVDGERVVGTVDRDELVAVQTPQAFRAIGAPRRATPGGEARPTTPRSSKPSAAAWWSSPASRATSRSPTPTIW